MRLPWDTVQGIWETFVQRRNTHLLGCLSFEERCRAVPLTATRLSGGKCPTRLFSIKDPVDAFPDYSDIIRQKTNANLQALEARNVSFTPIEGYLLATEDFLFDS